jgi:hypothetical protein
LHAEADLRVVERARVGASQDGEIDFLPITVDIDAGDIFVGFQLVCRLSGHFIFLNQVPFSYLSGHAVERFLTRSGSHARHILDGKQHAYHQHGQYRHRHAEPFPIRRWRVRWCRIGTSEQLRPIRQPGRVGHRRLLQWLQVFLRFYLFHPSHLAIKKSVTKGIRISNAPVVGIFTVPSQGSVSSNPSWAILPASFPK